MSDRSLLDRSLKADEYPKKAGGMIEDRWATLKLTYDEHRDLFTVSLNRGSKISEQFKNEDEAREYFESQKDEHENLE